MEQVNRPKEKLRLITGEMNVRFSTPPPWLCRFLLLVPLQIVLNCGFGSPPQVPQPVAKPSMSASETNTNGRDDSSTADQRGATQLEVDATVSPHETKAGWLTLTVVNHNTWPVTFVDIPEGASNDLWSLDIRPKNGPPLEQFCRYAPGVEPQTITLNPNESFQRDFQTVAYASDRDNSLRDQACTVVIRYRNQGRLAPLGPLVHFSSRPATLWLSGVFDQYSFSRD